MSKPIYRGDAALVRDLRVCSIHAHNGDEIGLTPRQKVIARVIRRLTPIQRESLYLYYGRGLSMGGHRPDDGGPHFHRQPQCPQRGAAHPGGAGADRVTQHRGR